ncbi:MAG: TFIIB-type zinc finger domain-containing protein [Clostridia bacterium]|nr:TFIIB-type zinc finger domain-containing protein [Clostridia bacterium]
MKAIVCEMCGSNDVVKQDGMYVCQSCGTKYSPDEAKKLMIDISGSTVKIDNSAFVEKYLANARRAMQKEDWEETEKYYNMVEQNDPTNIEAIFYSSYGKAKTSLVSSDLYKRQAAFKTLINCVSIVDDNFNIEKEEEQKEILKKISADIIAMSCSNYVYNQKKNGYGIVTWTDKYETVTLFNTLNLEFCTTLEEIIKKYPPERAKDTVFYYELAIVHCETILAIGSLKNRQPTVDRAQRYHEEWHKIDSNHEIPLPKTPANKSGGCYVATAVYGSYDCPEVWTLRRYRDDTLAETRRGRAFIRTYYAISPTLVKWFGDKVWFKKMWRGRLDRMVRKLNENGVDNMPYEDKEW